MHPDVHRPNLVKVVLAWQKRAPLRLLSSLMATLQYPPPQNQRLLHSRPVLLPNLTPIHPPVPCSAPAVAPLAIPPFSDQAHLASSVHCAGLLCTSLPPLATPSCTSLPTFATPSCTSLPTLATSSCPPTCWLPVSCRCITFTGTLSYSDFAFVWTPLIRSLYIMYSCDFYH